MNKGGVMKPRKVKFPFKSRLSLKPLLDFWDRLLAEGKYGLSSLGPVIRQKIENNPELLEPIDDLSMLNNYKELSRSVNEPSISAGFLGYRLRCGVRALRVYELLCHPAF